MIEEPAETSLRVDVLGPLRLTVGGTAVDVPGPKRRALLALLVEAEGRAVPVGELLDALWPTDLPDSARATLHSHLSRLRGHLGPAATRLSSLPGAYRLRIDSAGTDVALARSLLAAARSAGPERALELLGEARALWRGAPLAEFDDVEPLEVWALTLSDLRRSIDEAYASAVLDAGTPTEATEITVALLTEHPLSETAVSLHMRALAAVGRRAEALCAAHDFRRRVATETGLDPSPSLAELEREIAVRGEERRGGVSRPDGPLRGRDAELAALHRLLHHERLVTLVGAGGVGKTRLAVEIATRTSDATALLLAPVTDRAAIPHALASALRLRVMHGDPLDACAALLGAGRQLLLIDNCEHLLDGVRAVITTLLDACPQLTVLVTSREPLGLPSEQRFRLAPLPLTALRQIDELARAPAAAVFVDRARRVRPDFTPGSAELSMIVDIVRRLDGMPLAIELAAGRMSSLGLEELSTRLDRALDIVGDGRGRTLRRTVQWSYDLLPDPEQRLLRHLGTFPGGFDLQTAEFVAAELDLPDDPVAALSHLVDASMVEVILDGPSRYRMLDTIRAFTADELEIHDEVDGAVRLFLRWALEVTARIQHAAAGPDEDRANALFRGELANLRAAWQICRERERIDDAVRLVLDLGDAAGWRDLTEVWGWTLDLTDDPAVGTHPAAAEVLGVGANSAWFRGELDRADRLAHTGLGIGGEGSWQCRAALAMIALSRGQFDDASAHGISAAADADRPDQSLGIAALAAAYAGHLDQAANLNDRLAAIAASCTLRGFHAYVAGEIAALRGLPDLAEEHYQTAIRLSRQSGATFLEGIASVGHAGIVAKSGRLDAALDRYHELIDYWERTGGWIQQWTTLRNLAALLRSLGDETTARSLEAAADHAPDAPPGNASRPALGAAAPARSEVLELARSAIARHRDSV